MTAKHNVVQIENESQLNLIASSGTAVLNFWATWHEPCQHMNLVFEELSKNYPKLHFFQLLAEEFAEFSETMGIETVPTFLILKNGIVSEKVEGANASSLTAMVSKHNSTFDNISISKDSTELPAYKQDINQKLKTLINSFPVMLFMKGSPSVPKCGFSRQLLEQVNCTYGSFDILLDDDVRQGLKKYSDWPTFPQLYVSGELVGGLDILKELVESGEFQKMLPKEDNLNTRLEKLLKSASVLLFMKGTRDSPKCGFSRTIVSLLKDEKVDFSTFDILEDEEVRQGLKVYSDWPTYPQLYINQELVGGLDIVKEMIQSGDLQKMLK